MLKTKIVELSNFCAGRIQDQQFFLNPNLAEEALQNNREESLGLLIAEDINTKEADWVNYEFEETQTKLDLSYSILESLVFEVIEILQ